MAGYIRQDTTNNIADGNIINASDFDSEYNAIEAAFNASTGHTHDGTSAEGAPITKIGPTQDVVATASSLYPKTDNTVDLGSSTLEYKDLWIDGTANIDSLVADTADINAGTIDGVTIGGASAGAGTFTTVAATTGNITTVNATTLDATNVEVTNIKAKDGTAAVTIANSTGVVTVASAVLTTADINAGTVDNASIGAATPSTGAFTTLSASGTTTLSGLTASTALALDASKNVVSVTNTGTGNNVLSASPTLTGTLTAAAITASGTVTGNGNWVLGNADTDTITQAASYIAGTQLKSAKTSGNTLNIAAYDVDGAAYTNLVTLAASNTPTLTLTSTGVGTINNMSIGATTASTGAFTTLSASSTTTLSGLTASTALALNASKQVVSVTNTGSGNNVLATSPTLTTPNLGTPSAVTLTNATGLPVSTGISGLGTGVAAFLATPSSTNLAAAVTDETGSGALVFATSPTLTTPNLGTPSAVTLTNATGLPVSTGISGLGSGVATFLATPSSANLAAAVTDETGSGSLVFATSPTLTTPNLGTPSAVTLTNATGLPVSTGISGLGTGVATFLATPSSANLAAAVTGETGSGALVFATSPTLVTPTLGVATATSINKVAITAPATSATLTIANGKTLTANSSLTLAGVDAKTLTVNNSLTLAGTDATTMTFPSTSGTVATLNTAQTFSAYQTFGAGLATGSGQVLTLDQGNIARINGTAPAYYMNQDGTGRQHWYWNTSGGTSPTFAVGNEDATGIMMSANNNGNGGYFIFRTASGVGKNAGDPLSWSTVLYADLATFQYMGVEVVRVSGSQNLTGKTYNGLSLTANATGFSVAGGTTSKTLTVNNSLTLAGTDATTMTFPAASTTVAGLGTTQTFSGSNTFSSTFTLSGTTAAISLGTSQTSGTTTIGGTAQTGTITVGRSTGAQTLDLGVGATTSGTTKTINIGTAGVSGSTTNINYGSAISGAGGAHIWNVGGEKMRLDASGNLGLGVTPSAWGAGFTALQMKSGGASLWTDGLQRFFLSSNVFYNGTNRIYQTAGAAGEYIQNAGAHQWYTAPSGTAGNAISFTQAMTLNTSGFLGVGTTIPSNLLHIKDSTNPIFRLEAATDSGYVDYTATRLQLSAGGGAMYFVTGSTERMRLNSSGNLGIGTSSPTQKLEVQNGYIVSGTAPSTSGSKILGGYYSNGQLATFGGEQSNGGPVIGYGVWPSTSAAGSFVSSTAVNVSRGAYTIVGDQHVWYNGGAQTVAIDSAVTTSERMRLDASGNLGIGTTSPSTRLHIVGDSTTEFRVVSSSNLTTGAGVSIVRFGGSNSATSGYVGYGGTSSTIDVWNTLSGSITFGTNNTERARITSAGDLLVGSTSSTPQNTAASAFGTGPIAGYGSTWMQIPNNAVSSYKALTFFRGSTEIGSVSYNGTGVNFNGTSDRRLKENIQPAADAAPIIDAIEIVQHDWKAGGHTRFGVIAQDLHAVAPEAVTPGDDGAEIEKTWGVDYSKLVPMLIKEIQSLRARVAALETN